MTAHTYIEIFPGFNEVRKTNPNISFRDYDRDGEFDRILLTDPSVTICLGPSPEDAQSCDFHVDQIETLTHVAESEYKQAISIWKIFSDVIIGGKLDLKTCHDPLKVFRHKIDIQITSYTHEGLEISLYGDSYVFGINLEMAGISVLVTDSNLTYPLRAFLDSYLTYCRFI